MRIAPAEDGALFRDGLLTLLRAEGHQIVGAVESGLELASLLTDQPAKVAILAIRMPRDRTAGSSQRNG